MNAEEIRKMIAMDREGNYQMGAITAASRILRELTAQVAELNETLRLMVDTMRWK